MVDVARMRAEYETRGLDVGDLDPDPINQFRVWLAAAAESEVAEPNAMVVSTVSTDGSPWSRYLLLKDVTDGGFSFFTNYESEKSRHLVANGVAAITFGWLALHRQVNISGSVERVSDHESDEYWAVRPRGSQLGGWASRQSVEIADRSVLDGWYADVEERFAGGEVPRPSHWGGWRVRPTTIEFWQGRVNRLHDRFRYRIKSDGSWSRSRLSP